jgi:IPT/TIG domain
MMRLIFIMLFMLTAIPPGFSWGEAPVNPPASSATPSQDIQDQVNDLKKRLTKIEQLTQPVENLSSTQIVKALENTAAVIKSVWDRILAISLISLLLAAGSLIGVLVLGLRLPGNLNAIATHLPDIGKRLQEVTAQFQNMGTRLERVTTEFQKMDTRLQEVTAQFQNMGTRLLEITIQLQNVRFLMPISPIITGINPDTGTVGQEITLHGNNFQPGIEVEIGRQRAPVRRNSAVSLTIHIPQQESQVGAGTKLDVRVRNPDGQEYQLKDGFTYQ